MKTTPLIRFFFSVIFYVTVRHGDDNASQILTKALKSRDHEETVDEKVRIFNHMYIDVMCGLNFVLHKIFRTL